MAKKITVTEFTVVLTEEGHLYGEDEDAASLVRKIKAEQIKRILAVKLFPGMRVSVWSTGYDELEE